MSSTPRFDVAGRAVPLAYVRSSRAGRLTLRADAVKGVVRVSLPARARLAEAEAFVAAHAGWIAARVAKWPLATPFDNGTTFAFDGATLTLDWHADHPRGVRRDGDRLVLGGPQATVPGRTLRWLRATALADLDAATRTLARAIDARVTTVTVRDAAGRWGSCARSGAINYSWRLILAPPAVRQSVVAHEVAHLVHPNHGRDFWKLAERLTTSDLAAARGWLNAHGAALHWVGRAA